MHFSRKIKIVLFLALSWFSFSALAASSPLPMLQNTANQIVSALNQNKAALKNNPQISYSIVNRYLVPLVDQNEMAQAVLGRNVWQNATSTQKTQFIQQFRLLVVRTYAAAFSQFSDEQVQFKPIRNLDNSASLLKVNSLIVRSNGPSIPVSYTLKLEGSNWKVVDFAVDNVSMVQSFKSQFQGQLSSGGLDTLIANLTSHNAKNG